LKKLFEYWSWNDTWATVGLLVVATVAILIGFSLSGDHRVQQYYLNTQTSSDQQVCVYAYRDWTDDLKVACFPATNPNEALEFLSKANEELRKTR
jgi:hypothetical protein